MHLKTDSKNEKNGGYTLALFSSPSIIWGSTRGGNLTIAVHFRIVKVTYNSSNHFTGEIPLNPETLKDSQKLRVFNYCKKLAEEYGKNFELKITRGEIRPDYFFSNTRGRMVVGREVSWCLINARKK